MLARSLSIAALLALPSALCADTVFVVDDDGGPGVDFTDIQSAIDGVASGDVLLIKEGDYEAFSIVSKSLVLIADTDQTVSITGQVQIERIVEVHVLNLVGLEIANPSGAAVEVRECDGPVLLQSCSLTGEALPSALAVVDSVAVTLVDCDVETGASTAGVAALSGLDSSIHVFNSDLSGGEGASTQSGASSGGPAATLAGGFLYASGSNLTGGSGGAGQSGTFGCTDGADGGAGLVTTSSPKTLEPATAEIFDSVIQGGPAGSAGSTSCSPGQTGTAIQVSSGAVNEVEGKAYPFSVLTPIRALEFTQFDFCGAPGDCLFAIYGSSMTPQFYPILQGSLIPPTTNVDYLGVFSPTGEISLLVAYFLFPSQGSNTLYFQSAVFNATDGFVLSEPRSLVVVPAGL